MSFSESDIKRMMREVMQEGSSKEDHVSHVVGCPDCYKAVIKKADETMNYHCENCGLPLPEAIATSETESCPNCGCEDCDEIPMENRLIRAFRG